MKATELMIGDYARVNRDGLCIKKGTIVEIRGIIGDAKLPEENLVGLAACRPLDKEQFVGIIWCEYLCPIPLTPEILEKNGFEKNEFSLFMYPLIDGVVRFDEHQYGLYCNILRPFSRYDSVCNYVHQLQHALGLCGIDKEIEL